ncbi:MAG: type II secretion system protein GspK [Roseiarcus sp.]|jgi:general secretion pathway protein K
MNRRGEDGFIIIAVLWMIAALAALASAYAVYAVQTAPSAALAEERLGAEAAIRAGVELCAFRQLAWPKPARPDAGAFSTEVGAGRIDVLYRSESARVDLNAAPRELIAGLFAQLGASNSAAGFLADRVVAWRGKLKESDRRQEAAVYANAGLGYGPLGAPFDNVLELSLLPGMSPALAERALRFVTIFGGGKIDPLVADPLVLAALPGVTPEIANGFMAARSGPPPDSAALARMAGPVKDFIGADPNDYVRAEIVASVGNRRIHAQVVLKIAESEPAPYDILYWRDDFDGEGTGG